MYINSISTHEVALKRKRKRTVV